MKALQKSREQIETLRAPIQKECVTLFREADELLKHKRRLQKTKSGDTRRKLATLIMLYVLRGIYFNHSSAV